MTIDIRFTENVNINFVTIERCFVNTNKFKYKCILPIIVGTSNDKFHINFKPLFKTQFEFEIKTIVKLEKILKNINYCGVDIFFKKHFPESDFLKKLRVKAKNWISKDIPEPVLFGINDPKSEFIKCDSETKFYGNYTLNGFEGCLLDIGEREKFKESNEYVLERKPFFIRLSGNDDDSWTKFFNTKTELLEEIYRLRRCQPINKDIDVINNGYVFTN